MYQAFFGLKDPPFSITPDTRFTYLSPQHEEALAHLLYGAYQHGSGGFALLTGEIGSGKTTLCRLLLERLDEDTETIWILNPLLKPDAFLQACLEELGQPADDDSHYTLYQRFNQALLHIHAQGRRCLLLIDEAQLLAPDTLELLRLLTNLETGQQKLLQILLVGQPELHQRLQQPDAAPLNQRITARYHLHTLDLHHATAYLQHRLKQAGASRPLLRPAALRALARASRGVPRLLNILADRALLVAYAQGATQVTGRHARQAIRECQGQASHNWPMLQGRNLPRIAGLLLTALLVAAWAWPLVQHARLPELPPPLPLQQAMALLGAPASGNGPASPCHYPLADDFHCLTYHRAPATLPSAAFPLFLPATAQPEPPRGWLLESYEPLQIRTGDGTVQPASRAALMQRWRGDLLLLWHDPWRMPELLRPGDRHPALARLRQRWQLPEGDTLDSALQQRLKQFQTRQGIPADGILGPLTQFFLYRNRLLEP